MKISQEYLDNFKNMSLEEFRNFVKKDDITEEKMIMLKNEIEKDVNLYNDLQNLISKYGLERTPRMLEIIIDEMKIYLKLLTQYEKEASQWQLHNMKKKHHNGNFHINLQLVL